MLLKLLEVLCVNILNDDICFGYKVNKLFLIVRECRVHAETAARVQVVEE